MSNFCRQSSIPCTIWYILSCGKVSVTIAPALASGRKDIAAGILFGSNRIHVPWTMKFLSLRNSSMATNRSKNACTRSSIRCLIPSARSIGIIEDASNFEVTIRPSLIDKLRNSQIIACMHASKSAHASTTRPINFWWISELAAVIAPTICPGGAGNIGILGRRDLPLGRGGV